jgi:hypothetical protein
MTSRIVRAVRTSGTVETKITIGGFRDTLTRWEALTLLKDLFLAVWGADFNDHARRK